MAALMFYGPAKPDSKQICRARYACRASIQPVRVDHCCLHITVSQKLLKGSNVGSTFKQVGGKAMAKGMAAGGFADPGSSECSTNGALNDRGIKMMATLFPSLPIPPARYLREHPLPNPFTRG